MIRLQKAISDSGFCSRRKAEEYILKGKVFVNGNKITELGVKVSNTDNIIIDGNLLSYTEKEYYVLNKPRGVISSTKDDKGRKTVLDFFDTDKRLYPIGRLDYDTTGVILITNDGEFANLMMHPKNMIQKSYIAKLKGIIDGSSIKKIRSGTIIDGVKCIVEIVIHDGKNHEVKRIFQNAGYDVIKLKRESFGFISLDGLSSGKIRKLTKKEVKQLYNLANKKGL